MSSHDLFLRVTRAMSCKKVPNHGARFGRWTVCEHLGSNRHGMTIARALCDCGRSQTVIIANLRAGVSTQCKPCSVDEVVLRPQQMAAIEAALRSSHYHGQLSELARRFGVPVFVIRRFKRDLERRVTPNA